MKIRFKGIGQHRNNVDLDVIITQKYVCPAGTAYWQIDYCIDGICIHSASTGAIYGSPNPIEMLESEFTWNETHYQDILNPDPVPEGEERQGRKIGVGTSGDRQAWFETKSKTHRQAIIDALEQIVEEDVE